MANKQTNKQTKSNGFIYIRQATKTGFIRMKSGGVCDVSYPTSKIRRGRVQGNGDISPAILTSGTAIVKIDLVEE